MPETTARPSPIDRARAGVSWLLAPATEEVPRSHAVAAASLRILLGLLWLYNVAWKRAPDFGQEAGNGLYKFTAYAVSHPVFAPYSWIVENVVLEVFTPFGWMVLFAEATLAVMLLTGAWVRLAAAIGLAQSVAIALSVAFAPHEWPWSYWLMIGAHGLILFSSAGRVLAVDGVRAGLGVRRTLGSVWGVLTILVGLYSVLRSFGDPLASRGPGLRSTDLSLSLGEYNLIGGLVLIVVGATVLMVARGASARIGQGGAGLAALAGVSLLAQFGFSSPLLGGTPTSAAYFFSVAVVAAAISLLPAGHSGPTRR